LPDPVGAQARMSRPCQDALLVSTSAPGKDPREWWTHGEHGAPSGHLYARRFVVSERAPVVGDPLDGVVRAARVGLLRLGPPPRDEIVDGSDGFGQVESGQFDLVLPEQSCCVSVAEGRSSAVVVAEVAVAAVRLRFFEGAGALDEAKKSSSAGRLGAATAVEVEARGACFCLQGLRLDACGRLP
jgi:hypothetical protein